MECSVYSTTESARLQPVHSNRTQSPHVKDPHAHRAQDLYANRTQDPHRTATTAYKQYPCFYYNIRLYETGYLFNIEDNPNGGVLSRIIPKISWSYVYFMSVALTLNTALLIKKYLASDKQVLGKN